MSANSTFQAGPRTISGTIWKQPDVRLGTQRITSNIRCSSARIIGTGPMLTCITKSGVPERARTMAQRMIRARLEIRLKQRGRN